MPDAFPETPVSLLACIREGRSGLPHQQAWKSLFDLYHGPIRFAVLSAFRRCNWRQVPEELLEETIADVVVSFYKADFSYDPGKGRFRSYLRQICAWRVCDQIEKMSKIRIDQLEPLESLDQNRGEFVASFEGEDSLEKKEQSACRSALLATMLEDVRNRVSPQTFLMFELTKIQGRNPEEVAAQFRVKRNVIDNASYRVISKLKELATQPEYQREYFE